jgi:predicted dehydrogenase
MHTDPTLSRRRFLAGTGTALAASMMFPASVAAGGPQGERIRLALVGTGSRGSGMWGRSVVRDYSDRVSFVGLCDSNPGRLAYARRVMGVDAPTYLAADFDRMVRETRPDRIVVCTTDSTHDAYVVRGMQLGCDIITEKPITTDELKCQAILDAQRETGRHVTVTHNMRYMRTMIAIKELLKAERIGSISSVDFNWYLDVYHGADYFRRWHGERAFGGTLLVHKASHHFDALNWWLASEPEEVFGYGALEYYGRNNPYRHTQCRGCPHQARCPHYWDITASQSAMDLYVANERFDGYLRDGCVWREAIDIPDKMGALIRYANGVTATYSCTTYSPYEGFRIAFNGTKGRLETWVQSRQPWPADPFDEIRVTDNFGETEVLRVPHVTGDHGGADALLKDRIFRTPEAPDPLDQFAGLRDGTMAVLIGVAARKSIDGGEPVRIEDLTTLRPRARRDEVRAQ